MNSWKSHDVSNESQSLSLVDTSSFSRSRQLFEIPNLHGSARICPTSKLSVGDNACMIVKAVVELRKQFSSDNKVESDKATAASLYANPWRRLRKEGCPEVIFEHASAFLNVISRFRGVEPGKSKSFFPFPVQSTTYSLFPAQRRKSPPLSHGTHFCGEVSVKATRSN